MSVSNVLTTMAPKGMEILKSSLQQVNATGKTINSISFVVDKTNNRLTYFGRPFIRTIETGRGPRKQSTYGNFDTNLDDWLKVKGFPTKKSKSGTTYYQIGDQWFSAKSLAWRINKDGDKQFRSGQVRDIYTKAMQAFKEELITAIKKDQREEFKNKIKQMF